MSSRLAGEWIVPWTAMSLTLCGSGNRVYRIAGECQDLGSNIGLNGVYSHPQSLKKKIVSSPGRNRHIQLSSWHNSEYLKLKLDGNWSILVMNGKWVHYNQEKCESWGEIFRKKNLKKWRKMWRMVPRDLSPQSWLCFNSSTTF